MEVFKGNGKNNAKGVCTFDFSNEGKHLSLGMEKTGYLIAALYYDDIGRAFDFEETFTIDKSDMQVYNIFDKYFSKKEGATYFETRGCELSLEKEEDGYCFHFVKTYEEENKIMESKLVGNYFEENTALTRLLMDLQAYDPKYHQVHMEEYAKTLNKSKKNIEK